MLLLAPWFLATLSAAPTPAPAGCHLEGRPRHLEALVRFAGPAFGVALGGVPVSVELPSAALAEGVDPARVEPQAVIHVLGPLVFDAVVAPEALPVRPRRAWRGDAGFLTLGPLSRLVAEQVSGAELAVHVALDDQIHVPAVRAKCVDLTLGDTLGPAPTHRTPPVAQRMVPTGETLPLRRAPDAALPAWIVAVGKGSALELARLARRGAWVQVAASWSDGTRVAGWTEATNVEWFDGEFGDFLALTGTGMCGYGVSDTYNGPAILHGGASVHASADGPVWARAAKTTRVVVIGRDGWVELAEVPGLGASNSCDRLENAYVRAEDLTYPPF